MQHALVLFFGAGRGRGKRRLRSPAVEVPVTCHLGVLMLHWLQEITTF